MPKIINNMSDFNRMKEEINKWLPQNIYSKTETRKLHIPYRYKDYIIVLGECSGVVIFPFIEDTHFLYMWLEEDDGRYWVSENPPFKDITWIQEDIKCAQIALDYIKKYATVLCFKDTDIPCSWQLPFKNENI